MVQKYTFGVANIFTRHTKVGVCNYDINIGINFIISIYYKITKKIIAIIYCDFYQVSTHHTKHFWYFLVLIDSFEKKICIIVFSTWQYMGHNIKRTIIELIMMSTKNLHGDNIATILIILGGIGCNFINLDV